MTAGAVPGYKAVMASTATRRDPRQGRREERKAENRAKLLAAARKVFSEKGLGAATARDIVRETDLASGTFYNYFRDKEELFRALVEELADKARAVVSEQRRSPGRTLEERIEAAYRAYFELVCEERELFVMLRRNAGMLGPPATDPLLEAGIGDLIVDLADWEEAGELPDVDLDYLATAIVGTGVQIANHLVERDPPDVDAATRFCTRLFVGGIRSLSAG